MSGQRSDWRERLHANPSRMEQELAIKLQDDGIHSRNVKSSCFSWHKPRVWRVLKEERVRVSIYVPWSQMILSRTWFCLGNALKTAWGPLWC